ncbi:MFS transporter [Flexivirga aerilata]
MATVDDLRNDRPTRPGSPAPDAVRRASRSVMIVFALNGAAFATYASRIPDTKSLLHLSAGQLGLFLLAGALGSVLGLPMSGWITGRFGARRTVLAGSAATTLGYSLSAIGIDTHQLWLAAVSLFVAGWGVGIWDVAMNLEGTVVEQHLGRSIMPRFHAMFSGGTVAAALLGAGLTALRVPVWLHVIVVMALLAAGTAWAAGGFRALGEVTSEPESSEKPENPDSATEPAGKSSHLSAWLDPRVLLIGVVTLAAGFTEGTANDWLSVAFVEGHNVPKWAGVLAFATFLTFMTIGRITGTAILDRHGRVPVLRCAFALAVVGCLAVVFGSTPIAYAGVVVWGVGVSLGFPVGMSAAADDPAQAHARISVVSTIAYTAFLAGPPLLGFLGEHVGVLHALLAVGAAATLALLLVPSVREPDRSHAAH